MPCFGLVRLISCHAIMRNSILGFGADVTAGSKDDRSVLFPDGPISPCCENCILEKERDLSMCEGRRHDTACLGNE